jgi:hypothetical protein
MNVPRLSETQMKAYNTLVDAGLPAEAKLFLTAATMPTPVPLLTPIKLEPKVNVTPGSSSSSGLKLISSKLGEAQKDQPTKPTDPKAKALASKGKQMEYMPKSCRPCFDRFKPKPKKK